jgi:hypothetical protein
MRLASQFDKICVMTSRGRVGCAGNVSIPARPAYEGAMSLKPTQTEKLARARSDLRLGLPVVLLDSGRAMLATAVEALTPSRPWALLNWR